MTVSVIFACFFYPSHLGPTKSTFCSHGFTSTVRKSVLSYMQVTSYKNNFIGIKWSMLPFLQNNNDAQNVSSTYIFP